MIEVLIFQKHNKYKAHSAGLKEAQKFHKIVIDRLHELKEIEKKKVVFSKK